MEKTMIEIPKEVAGAIESLRKLEYSNADILSGLLGNGNGELFVTIRRYSISEEMFNDILKALVNGYTVKPEDITVTITPEQQENIKRLYEQFDYNTARAAITKILHILGIRVEGVSDRARTPRHNKG